MSDPGANAGRQPEQPTPLTLLGSTRSIDDAALERLYAYPQQQAMWVRANFIASIDGGATVAGRSGGLGGPGDRALFALLRSLADIIVIGAGTVRVEKYSGVQLSATNRRRRRDCGQPAIPQLAIITRSGQLSPELPVFTRTEVPPLVLTCSTSATAIRDRLAGVVDPRDVVDCSGDAPDRVDEVVALAAIGARGHRRVLTEGGPTLLGSLVERDLLDELCLSMAPYLVGGQARRIATGPGQVHTAMSRAHLLADPAGYLYARYVKTVPADGDLG